MRKLPVAGWTSPRPNAVSVVTGHPCRSYWRLHSLYHLLRCPVVGTVKCRSHRGGCRIVDLARPLFHQTTYLHEHRMYQNESENTFVDAIANSYVGCGRNLKAKLVSNSFHPPATRSTRAQNAGATQPEYRNTFLGWLSSSNSIADK